MPQTIPKMPARSANAMDVWRMAGIFSGLAVKNRKRLTPAMQKFMEYLGYRDVAG